MPIIFVAGFFFLNARCTYAIVITSLLKLLNRPHWTIGFFSLACVMNVDVGMFSPSAAKTRLTCSGHSISGCFNQAGPVSHSLPLCSLTLMALVPMPAGLWIPLICFHCETLVVSKISATLFATDTCCLRFGAMNPLQNSSGVCPKVTTVNLRFVFLHYLLFKSHRHHCCL